MWQKLSIKNQLMILMAVLLTIVEISTLSLVSWFDKQERRTIAMDQAHTLGRSLNNDLLKALLSPRADAFSDITFRIDGFKSVDTLVLYDENHHPIFSHGDLNLIKVDQVTRLRENQSWFSPEGRLYLKVPVQADDYAFGQVLFVINPEQYQTRLKENFVTLLVIFPVLLLLGLLIAWKMSQLFTRPFSTLASAMRNNDIDNNHYNNVSTLAKNELGALFNGYNDMINQIRKTTRLMDFRSRHDSLTGLYNRFGIEQAIINALKQQRSSDFCHILLHIDLDQFKIINDSVGHTAGDELLKMLAHYISHDLAENYYVARVGGDDFFILIKNTTKEAGIKFAKKQMERLKDFRFFWDGNAITVSASMGMVAFRAFEYTLEELIKSADIAFYTAKRSGRNNFHLFNPQDLDSKRTRQDISIAGYIKEALNDGPAKFELYAQDIVPLQYNTEKISYEVLIRMWDSEENFLPPDQFLATAERYHLMVDIDIFVLWNYLTIVCKHPEHLQKLHSVHVNLAGGTLNHPDFQEKVKMAIDTFSFPWEKLELEITETSAVGNLAQASEFINYCQSLGIGFALDDFGTGMSSFEYLKNLPFNVVKIDGSFVRDMLTDPVDHAMIRYTHDISRLKNQETVAEYVETEEDLLELRKIGITYGQGYHLGKPRPLQEWL
jgi:diguanylate cyclase (GGDEF)-like protein